jgi:ferrochelatase
MSLAYAPVQRKTKVVFVQLGSPEEPTPDAVRKYLREFLGDPRVIDMDPKIWKVILEGFVLPSRPRKSAALYARIWDGENFPLITNTAAFAEGVREALTSLDPKGYVEINHAFLLSPPFVKDVYDSWEQDLARNEGASKLVVIPMFPQYSESTTASGIDALVKELGKRVKIPTFEVITNFHRSHAFIDNSVRKIDAELQRLKAAGTDPHHLVLSFHGMQKRRIITKGDDYYRHCFETYKLITDRLQHIAPENTVMTFQSRFGSEEWITPYTEEVVQSLIESGKTELVVYSPSFVADCLETTDELGHELVKDAREWGGNVHPVECLNKDAQWCQDFARYTFTQAEGSAQDKEDLEYTLAAEDYAKMPTLRMSKGSVYEALERFKASVTEKRFVLGEFIREGSSRDKRIEQLYKIFKNRRPPVDTSASSDTPNHPLSDTHTETSSSHDTPIDTSTPREIPIVEAPSRDAPIGASSSRDAHSDTPAPRETHAREERVLEEAGVER